MHQYDLERKFAGKITPYQIAEAFGIDCLDIVETRIIFLLKELDPFIKFCQKIRRSDLNDEAKDFWVLICKKLYTPKEMIDELNKLNQIKKLINSAEKPKGHISQEEITSAKHIDIRDLYDWEKLKNTSKGFIACCPFGHVDKTPSFSVKNNRFNCFSCGKYGDPVDFIMELTGKTFLDAVKHILGK